MSGREVREEGTKVAKDTEERENWPALGRFPEQRVMHTKEPIDTYCSGEDEKKRTGSGESYGTSIELS